MYGKIFMVIVQTIIDITPPRTNAIQYILSRKSLKDFDNILNLLIVFQTLLYCYVMYQQENGSIPILPDENHKFSEWNRVEVFYHLCNIVGSFLILRSYDTLKEYFNPNVTIKKDHKLITTGPYSLLVHPSYTGVILQWIFLFNLHFQLFRYIPVYFPSKLGNILSSWWFKAFEVISLYVLLYKRVIHEEKLMKNHFGKDWDVYSRQRKRFIPYIF
ncbi:6230_t:CDS:2 [Funneliformis geosporum]|uniref:Protein-S-isoprenylcysteine O-methyltransferase n=1 Tax=Funneliformis geosporum TaxID=1117311 RepID=A0A9W4T5N4_9GLOM|nr:19159_t:CDS:2 [Funneliformis geosporum]CAI2194221.1 6230_t:CDS:2 [Funneliformis geosporum]